MFSYALRVDLDKVSAVELCEFLSKRGSYIAVREGVPKNPHVHAIWHVDEAKIRIVRQWFTRQFPSCQGNGSYSLTVVKDLEKYERYCCKGDAADVEPDVIGRMGIDFTDDWVMKRHEEYWSMSEKSRQYKRTVDGKKQSFLDVVVHECKKKRVKWTEDSAIARIYLELAGLERKPINRSQLNGVVEGAKLQLCGDSKAVEQLVEKYYGQPFL